MLAARCYLLFMFFSFVMVNTCNAQGGKAATNQRETEKVINDNPKRNSLNTSFLGLTYKSYALNYVHQFFESHAILIEGLISKNYNDTMAYGANIGYRSYTQPNQSSGFWGFNGKYIQNYFNGAIDLYGAVLNVGYRIFLGDHFQFTMRLGAGYCKTVYDQKAAQDVKSIDDFVTVVFVQPFLDNPITLDGEFSVGYRF